MSRHPLNRPVPAQTNAGIERSEYQSPLAACVLMVDQMIIEMEELRPWLEEQLEALDDADLDNLFGDDEDE